MCIRWRIKQWAEKLPKWHLTCVPRKRWWRGQKINKNSKRGGGGKGYFNTGMDLLHVVLELLDGAFVQIATEQREQIGGQEEWLDERRAGQLPCHMENRVSPSREEGKWLKKNNDNNRVYTGHIWSVCTILKSSHCITMSRNHQCLAPWECQRSGVARLVKATRTPVTDQTKINKNRSTWL